MAYAGRLRPRINKKAGISKIEVCARVGKSTTTTTTTLFSYIKYTNITPPANSKANRGRWCVDSLRFLQ